MAVRDTEISAIDVPESGAGAELDVNMVDHLLVVLQQLLKLVISCVRQGGDFLKSSFLLSVNVNSI